jgi:hypothetical protein
MRRLIRRLELIPEHKRSDGDAKPCLTRDDREFLDLLKKHHRQQKYLYMENWWKKQDLS